MYIYICMYICERSWTSHTGSFTPGPRFEVGSTLLIWRINWIPKGKGLIPNQKWWMDPCPTWNQCKYPGNPVPFRSQSKGFHQRAMCCPAAPRPRPPMTWEEDTGHATNATGHSHQGTAIEHAGKFTLPEFSFDVRHLVLVPLAKWRPACGVH